MNIKFILVAILAAFFLSGCSVALQDAVQVKEFAKAELVGRADDLKYWYDRDRELTNSITSVLIIQGQAKITNGDIEGGLKLFEQARAVHELAKPKFLLQKFLAREKANKPAPKKDAGEEATDE